MKIIDFSSEKTFVEGVLSSLHSRIFKKNKEARVFRLALSGGSTPVPIYQRLAQVIDIDWPHVEIYLVDERYVPRDDPNSNYKMIDETFIKYLPNNTSFISFDTSKGKEESLKEYEKKLDTENQTFFDLVLLGVGNDGHTASLFPGEKELLETERWVGLSTKGDPVSERLTLTYPALESSKEIFVLAKGEKKKKLIESILSGKSMNEYPITRILLLEKTTIFLED